MYKKKFSVAHEISKHNKETALVFSEKHIENRLTWVKENLNRIWDNIFFSDEAFFGHVILSLLPCVPVPDSFSEPSNTP